MEDTRGKLRNLVSGIKHQADEIQEGLELNGVNLNLPTRTPEMEKFLAQAKGTEPVVNTINDSIEAIFFALAKFGAIIDEIPEEANDNE